MSEHHEPSISNEKQESTVTEEVASGIENAPDQAEIPNPSEQSQEPDNNPNWQAIEDNPGIIRMLTGYFMNRNGGHLADAEDLVQQTLMRAGKAKQQYDANKSGGKLSVWILTFANWEKKDTLRRNQTRSAREAEFTDATANRAISKANTENIADEICERHVINEAIAKLSEQRREVIRLVMYGLTQTDIAAKLNIPLGTVKTRARLAKQALREHLASRNSTIASEDEPAAIKKSQAAIMVASRQRFKQAAHIAASRRRAARDNPDVSGASSPE